MDCDCFSKVKEVLEKSNMEFVDLGLAFDVNGKTVISVGCKEINSRKRKMMLLNYCPFCGKKLESGMSIAVLADEEK